MWTRPERSPPTHGPGGSIECCPPRCGSGCLGTQSGSSGGPDRQTPSHGSGTTKRCRRRRFYGLAPGKSRWQRPGSRPQPLPALCGTSSWMSTARQSMRSFAERSVMLPPPEPSYTQLLATLKALRRAPLRHGGSVHGLHLLARRRPVRAHLAGTKRAVLGRTLTPPSSRRDHARDWCGAGAGRIRSQRLLPTPRQLVARPISRCDRLG